MTFKSSKGILGFKRVLGKFWLSVLTENGKKLTKELSSVVHLKRLLLVGQSAFLLRYRAAYSGTSRHRLMARTRGFHPRNRSSILRGVTIYPTWGVCIETDQVQSSD